MHELGMCEDIVHAVERRADGRQVTGVRVHVGALNRVVPSAFEMSFSLAAAGTVAENAVVDLVIDPARFRCRHCHDECEGDDVIAVCAHCRGDLEVLSGEEIVLESISVAATADV